MNAQSSPKKAQAWLREQGTWTGLLRAKVVRNEAARVQGDPRQELRITVKQKPQPWLVPPLSWMLRPAEEKEVHLDRTGCAIYELCHAHRTVEDIVEDFGKAHRLTFHEARVAVCNYLYGLVQRGVLVLVLPQTQAQEDDDARL
ncbi:MAG: PqqD family protein [Opitutales bacterium]